MLETAVALLRGGAIVLMHDALGPGALRTGVEETIGLIAPLVALARDRGLRAAALSQADDSGAAESDALEASGETSCTAAQGVESLTSRGMESRTLETSA
jgi:hypothetical protein